jgi:hypothetical protein
VICIIGDVASKDSKAEAICADPGAAPGWYLFQSIERNGFHIPTATEPSNAMPSDKNVWR